MVNQICIAGVVQGLAEGINFAQKAGLDPDQVVDVIRYGAAQSWQMENRGRTMAKGEFDFGFAVEWMRKDLAIVLGEAQSQRGAVADDRVDRPVLRAGHRPWRQALGHLEPHSSARQRLRSARAGSLDRSDREETRHG